MDFLFHILETHSCVIHSSSFPWQHDNVAFAKWLITCHTRIITEWFSGTKDWYCSAICIFIPLTGKQFSPSLPSTVCRLKENWIWCCNKGTKSKRFYSAGNYDASGEITRTLCYFWFMIYSYCYLFCFSAISFSRCFVFMEEGRGRSWSDFLGDFLTKPNCNLGLLFLVFKKRWWSGPTITWSCPLMPQSQFQPETIRCEKLIKHEDTVYVTLLTGPFLFKGTALYHRIMQWHLWLVWMKHMSEG